MRHHNSKAFDTIIAGAGVVGLACAWRAARAGSSVCVLDRGQPGAGATGVAAGMLAPAGEAYWGEEELLQLNLASLSRWPAFASELVENSGCDVGFAPQGALHVALDGDEAEELRRRHDLHRRLGLDAEWLRGSEVRRLEPGVSTAARGGEAVPGEASVDPVALVTGLLAAAEGGGAAVETGADVARAERSADAWSVQTADGRRFDTATLVVCTGAWSGMAEWLPEEARPPVRPVKGEILTLRGREPVCERIVSGGRVYLVPRSDGRLIVGATVEERGFDTTVTAGGVHELLREAYRLIPEVAELELVEARAGLRPGSPDNGPIVGRGAIDGLLLATGHYRNGVLQAPVTADGIVALMRGDEPPAELASFSPTRFGAREPVGGAA